VTSTLLSERRLSIIVIASSVVAFLVLALIVPGFYPTFDEQKYLGIGYNLWTGNGPTTVFGVTFISHSPVWSAILAAPDVAFGIDPFAWGRFLNAVSGAAIVGLGGALGWRVRPAVGALAAAGILAIPYLHDLSRTARLDVPAAALALLYVFIGFEAIRRGSSRWAIAAGAIFAFGFLVKEIALPFAPIPFIAGILWNRPWVILARLGAWILLTASIGMSWWFAMYAALGHRVYRLDSPVWTLIPLTIGIVVAVVLGLSAGRLAQTANGLRLATWARESAPAFWRRHGRVILAWGLALAWFAILTLVFAKTSRLKGGSLIDIEQFRLYARTWLAPMGMVVLFGGLGVLLALIALVRLRDAVQRQAILDLVIATICAAPLVLLVVTVGEPPRNYLAQIAVLVAIAAAGAVWAIEQLATLKPQALLVPTCAVVGSIGGVVAANLIGPNWTLRAGIGGAVIGAAIGSIPWYLSRTGRSDMGLLRSLAVTTTLIAALLVATVTLGLHVRQSRPNANGREVAVSTVQQWLKANIPAGSKVAFPSFLGYEMALGLQGRADTVLVRARITIADPKAPEGLIRVGDGVGEDWIAVDTAPRNVNEYQAYRASWLMTDLGQKGVTYWVYSTGVSTAADTLVPALASSTGIVQVAHWTFPVPGTTPIDSYIFKIDPATLSFDTSKMYMAPDALDRLVTRLEQAAVPPVQVARTLVDRVVVTKVSALGDAAMTRLKALAGR
jgi:hypothetical protein